MLDSVQLRIAHAGVKAVAQRLRLPFHRRNWQGKAGNWLGVGIGSSIDFQDHRPYLPGDDPRYIDWQAYARTGHYTMKLYREEVSPRVDIVLDASPSMTFEPTKCLRTAELVYFALESGLVSSASVRCLAQHGGAWVELPVPSLLGYRWELPHDEQVLASAPMDLRSLPLRHGSLRVCISDLLFPGAPDELMRGLRAGRGRGVLFVPYAAAEADPVWDGNVEFIDCESGRSRRQRVNASLQRSYRDAYRRHFDLWTDAARRYDVNLSRCDARRGFSDDLLHNALPLNAVEIWN